ncbi:hypothetical protein HYW29_00255 [Candidatus Amesbacteria bacterium]|nr:hypothetical protein [Candidatus Amesbacteria bacterium]
MRAVVVMRRERCDLTPDKLCVQPLGSELKCGLDLSGNLNGCPFALVAIAGQIEKHPPHADVTYFTDPDGTNLSATHDTWTHKVVAGTITTYGYRTHLP